MGWDFPQAPCCPGGEIKEQVPHVLLQVRPTLNHNGLDPIMLLL
jgi:hypothetical protein